MATGRVMVIASLKRVLFLTDPRLMLFGDGRDKMPVYIRENALAR